MGIVEYLGSFAPKRMRLFLKKRLAARCLTISQVGQDLWVYGEVFNEKKGGFFVDVGAHNGLEISNSYLLETRYKWDGICIEANPTSFDELRKNRKCRCIHACVDKNQGTVSFLPNGMLGGILADDCDNNIANCNDSILVKTLPLGTILKENDAPKEIDYLSIDIEGAEDRALLDFEFSDYVFRCVTIERPSVALRDCLRINGYFLIKEIPGLDCFYIHESFEETYKRNIFAFGMKVLLYARLR
jgi:FkbM family methyltransferase